ncbi:MAG TPA: 3-oxoacyl-ACP synthase [Streptomyces sp.]|uniref:Beta-ketoacyl-[acyl-carrier-protein] synthase family protein n=1 Tax=Streptomyces salyersiae TaxID=3075530 RepID=A0ABU2RR23_9ACTN|nr:beta-ketoacyl-[acyl-carrier-protein] synthase family protein [Streptomyces sp. DSM 41770]MDT0431304.1 beta-ketoacyl-[acyl-carrier-protein] synthase family protein [Streptomyces sp. DSM 41770]HBF79878.1 3-oxoacyl-ACP synthase [Streptomyces sp.]
MSDVREAAVTGIGLLTPGGVTADATWTALCRGRGLARTDPALAGLPVDISCRIEDLDAEAALGRRLARRLDRSTHLALLAARQAVADAKLDPAVWRAPRVGVVLGCGGNSLATYQREFDLLGRGQHHLVSPTALTRSVPSMIAAEVALDLTAQGPNFTVASACSSGATALAVARQLIVAGACDIVLAGAGESGRDRMGATCFTQLKALSGRTADPERASRPFDAARDGFVLSEGAAVLVLEHPDHARRRGAHVRALLRGAASTCDAHHPVAPHPEGAGAEQAMRDALADAGCAPRDIGHVNAHGTSTPAGDTAEARALLRLFDGSPPPVTAPKGSLGHALGASAAVEAALTVLTLERRTVPPTANLVAQTPGQELDVVTSPRPAAPAAALTNSFGFGGQNTVLVLTTP